MLATRSVFVSLLSSAALVTVLAGCDRAEAPPAPKTGESPSSSGSVAAPSSSTATPMPEPSTPGSSSGQATGDSGDASGPNQAHPQDLTKQEESMSMPNSGQVNNHSTANPISEPK